MDPLPLQPNQSGLPADHSTEQGDVQHQPDYLHDAIAPSQTLVFQTEAKDVDVQQSFEFVVNESAKASSETVSKHEMKEHRRQERQDSDKSLPSPKKRRVSAEPSNETPTMQFVTPTSSRPVTGSGLMTDWPHRPGGCTLPALPTWPPDYEKALEEMKQQSSIPYIDPGVTIAASDLDPLSRLHIQLGPATKSMISQVARCDPEPAHGIIGFILIQIARLRGLPEPALAFEHKGYAINLIQARVADPREAMSDDTIGVVIHAANWELIHGNWQGFAFHMGGLRKMVVGRGGIEALRHKPDLQGMIVRLDIVREYIALSAPRDASYHYISTLKPLVINVPPSSATPLARAIDKNRELVLCERSLDLLLSLERVLPVLRSIPRDTHDPEFGRRYRVSVSASVQQCLSPHHTRVASLAELTSWKCERLATLIFLDAVLQHLFDGNDTAGSVCERLENRFFGAQLDDPWMAVFSRLLHMMFQVLMAAESQIQPSHLRAFYFADALTMVMKLKNLDQVQSNLIRFIQERVRQSELPGSSPSSSLWNIKVAFEDVVLCFRPRKHFPEC